MDRTLTYVGVFLIALATLMLEILLTRIASVVAWYHLAFFVISLAMLGMTAGAVYVFLSGGDEDEVPERMAAFALGFTVSIPVSVMIALALPLTPVTDFMTFIGLLVIGGVLAVPFILGGVALTLALTRAGLPANLVYGVDLCGAALGCLLVIPLLDVVDAPSAALTSASFAGVASLAFARAAGVSIRRSGLATLALVLLTLANASASLPPLRPAWVKGFRESPQEYDYMAWNTYSRVTVGKAGLQHPGFWAHGRYLPPMMRQPVEQRVIKIDGAAGTVMPKLGGGSVDDHAYLGWDITAFVHRLRPQGPAAVIGVGGGRDVLEAVRVGHTPVVGVELNDLIVDLHEKHFAEFSGLSREQRVELVRDEARSYFARDPRSYDVITMSLIDTWASTGAGAYALSENGLYTVEAWQTFLERLNPNGLFNVSRWYVEHSPGETARMMTLAMETIWSMGGEDPLAHFVMLQEGQVATLLLSPTPLSNADLGRVQRYAVELGFNILVAPRQRPSHPLLKELTQQTTREEMWRWARSQELDLTPPTDERPFFFNMLKPSSWFASPAKVDQLDLGFLGNLQASQTLLYGTLVSLLLTLATIVTPMWRRRRQLRSVPRGGLFASGAYFALIGLGFMFVEMGLLSRLNVFLGHPTIALAVLLGGIIFFTGVGSILSGRIPVDNPLVARLYPLLPAALVMIVGLTMLDWMARFESHDAATRILVSIALLAPPALGMGLGFPLGLRLVERFEAELASTEGSTTPLGPWMWGINGAFGVCASGLALGTSMVFGVQTTLLIGASCYLLLPLCTSRLVR